MEFLTSEQARQIAAQFGTPVYVYSERKLHENIQALLAFPNAYGLIVRYAMKSLPTQAILQLINRAGLHIDASSGYEVERAGMAGIPSDHIQLTAQQLPSNLRELVESGMRFNACSLHQLETYGGLFPGREVGIRVNPGLGSGHCGRCNTGGPSSSFGIWHEQLNDAKAIAKKCRLPIVRLHTHIGSGADPDTWVKVAQMSLAIAEQLPQVKSLDLGGGFKVGRVPGENTTDLKVCGLAVKDAFEAFAHKTSHALRLEIEPGTYVVASAGSIIASIIDVVSTKPDPDGQNFIKVDSGMNENLRPSLYGAQHPFYVISQSTCEGRGEDDYVVVGRCCESGDILTPAPGNSEMIATRSLIQAEIGDLAVTDFAGAYCSGMPGSGYNSFPAAAEVLLREDGSFKLIRHRGTLEDLTRNEVELNL